MSEEANKNIEPEIKENEPQEGFKPVETQEEFDDRIKERISRAEAKARKAAEAEYAEAVKKAAEYDRIQEESKSELEKATSRAEAAERELGELKRRDELRTWAEGAGRLYSINPALIKGDTKEEMEAHAEAIRKEIDSAKPVSVPPAGKPAGAIGGPDDGLDARLRKAAGLG